MRTLSPLAAELAETLPIEPNGLSLHELADGLLGRRDPATRGQVKAALNELDAAVGGLYIGRGHCPEFGRFKVRLYGLRRPRDAQR